MTQRRHEARLCLCANLQQRFGDVTCTRALALAIRGFWFMTALTAAFNSDKDQLDVSGALFQAGLSCSSNLSPDTWLFFYM